MGVFEVGGILEAEAEDAAETVGLAPTQTSCAVAAFYDSNQARECLDLGRTTRSPGGKQKIANQISRDRECLV